MFTQRRLRQRADEAARRHHQEDVALAEAANRISRKTLLVTAGGLVVGLISLVIALIALSPPRAQSVAAHARVTLANVAVDAVVPFSLAQMHNPPKYPAFDSPNHCVYWWNDWLPREHAAEVFQVPHLEIAAPHDADATVVSAQVRVFKAFRPTNLTYVRCTTGSGVVPGTLLNVNLNKPSAIPTIVSDIGNYVPLSMPNAVINILPGHTEYIAVTPHGRALFYYWAIKLTIIVDQRAEYFTFGSEKLPLCTWFGRGPFREYDFNFSRHAWEQVS